MESFLADMIQEQRAQGIDANALVHGDPLPEDPNWLRRVPVQMSLIFAPIAVGFRAAFALAIEEIRPDVLHLHMPNNAVFWALTLPRARQIPWVVHWHSDVLVSPSQRLLKWAYKIYRPFEQAVLDQAERIVVTSPPYLAASEPLSRWQEKCAVIPLALKPVPTPEPVSSPWLRGRLKILSIGRLTYYKDFETLIRAVCGAPTLQLQILGGGELQVSLQALIEQLTPSGESPNVQLRGEVSESEKHQWLASCDAFALASCERTEAFGLVLLEAMAHGKACLVSNLTGSGMPWVVASSQAGLSYLPVGQPQVWRETLNGLNKEQLRQWGQNGKTALEQNFSLSSCVQTLNQQYQLAQALQIPVAEKPVLIVIPALNEAPTIGQVVSTLRKQGYRHVLVVDDHSSDGTGEIARLAGATVTRPVLPLGAWGGMQLGIRYALAQGHQAVITMDADGQHEVGEIAALLGAANQADVVIGAFPQRVSALRRLAWRWFRWIAGFELHDLTSGFRYYNRQAMTILAGEEATLIDYQDVGVLILLRRAGMHILEVPVTMKPRMVGKSKIFHSWLSVLRYLFTTTLLCLARWHVQHALAKAKKTAPITAPKLGP